MTFNRIQTTVQTQMEDILHDTIASEINNLVKEVIKEIESQAMMSLDSRGNRLVVECYLGERETHEGENSEGYPCFAVYADLETLLKEADDLTWFERADDANRVAEIFESYARRCRSEAEKLTEQGFISWQQE